MPLYRSIYYANLAKLALFDLKNATKLAVSKKTLLIEAKPSVLPQTMNLETTCI